MRSFIAHVILKPLEGAARMKKLINSPGTFVRESLEGMTLAHPELVRIHFDPTFVYRADAPVLGKVALISGGGSGHEPMHGGFVGHGMLDAACPGEVFTSPTPDQMYEAAMAVHGGAGVLFLVKNYAGDVMNFEMATEMAQAGGLQIASVLVDDDVAVKDSLYTQGRRGVGATVLVEKICGAAAQKGYDLARLTALARRAALGGRSMGMALTSCTVPAKGSPTFELGDGEMEVGIGIHGEPGRQRLPLASADSIADMLSQAILEDPAYTRTVREWDGAAASWKEISLTSEPLRRGDRVLAFVNSMGGTPLAELYVVYRRLDAACKARGIRIERTLIGPYITSLEMQGVSVTLLRVDDEMLGLWDAPVRTPGLRWGL
jgi:phosphoenolpyruvate---glycerone phosphotransferase subunit DhaK